MATRVRQSAVATTPQQRRTGIDPPPYEPPKFSLNPAAQRALAQLHQAHSLKKLDESLGEAQSALSLAAAEINDRLTTKAKRVKKLKENGNEHDDVEEMEKSFEELRDKVERMTQRMDESMRKLIDGQHSVQSIKESLATTAEDARAHASTQASTQNVRSQRPRRRVINDDGEEEDAEDEDYQDFTPTDPAGATQAQHSAIEAFRSKMDNSKTRYQSHSLTNRYANNNDYRNFRRVVHDAKHPDEDVPMAHHNEWFDEGQAPAPGVTTRGRANVEDEDDDDIAVSRATISTKCPLTLQEFKAPLTSTKCPHSFESEAILSMISQSTTRENNRANGERIVRCPVSGCDETLGRNDLRTDAVLVRKIKRIQRAKELEEEDAEDDDHGARGGSTQGATVIDDDDDDGAADVDDIVEGRVVPQTQMKKEPKASATKAGTQASAPPRSSAAVVELGTSSEEEADENVTMEDESVTD